MSEPQAFGDRPPAPVPASRSLPRLAEAVQDCRACDLHADTTQAVFGSGRRSARIVMVGEQPGDVEDRDGEPFVGPAGKLLERAMDEAGLSRSTVYLTNAVKHFKFRRAGQGKRRIHEKPDAAELAACRPWLRAELNAVCPDVIVVLGATAAATMLGRSFRVSRQRGRPLEWSEAADRSPLERSGETSPVNDAVVVATVHPSSVLRSRDREADYRAFVADLEVVASLNNP